MACDRHIMEELKICVQHPKFKRVFLLLSMVRFSQRKVFLNHKYINIKLINKYLKIKQT